MTTRAWHLWMKNMKNMNVWFLVLILFCSRRSVMQQNQSSLPSDFTLQLQIKIFKDKELNWLVLCTVVTVHCVDKHWTGQVLELEIRCPVLTSKLWTWSTAVELLLSQQLINEQQQQQQQRRRWWSVSLGELRVNEMGGCNPSRTMAATAGGC